MNILVLPGDGIGPEITDAALAVLQAADRRLSLGLAFTRHDIGLASLAAQGTTLPEAVLAAIPQADGVILGPVSHYEYPAREQGGINPSGELRVRYDLTANIRPLPLPPRPQRPAQADGPGDRAREHRGLLRRPQHGRRLRRVHARRGHGPGGAQDHRAGQRRVARTAFEIARGRRRKVTAVHKANVLKLTDGLFLREVRRVAQDFPRWRWTS